MTHEYQLAAFVMVGYRTLTQKKMDELVSIVIFMVSMTDGCKSRIGVTTKMSDTKTEILSD